MEEYMMMNRRRNRFRAGQGFLGRGQRQCLDIGHRCQLSDLKIGQKGRVLAIHNDNPALRRRLLDMGITKGVEVEIKKIAPMGDPIDITLRGYELCIRYNDMKNIDVEVIL